METTYLYVVHSDMDEQHLYAEFFDKDKAIAYAKANEAELTWVEELEVSLDEDQEVMDVFNSETIWIAGMDIEEAPTKEVEDDIPTREDSDHRDSFEDLVEKLEEAEDTVECKECFELFPKADCIKLDIGYICPTCNAAGEIFTVADENTFKVDFPEYEKFDNRNEMIPEEDISAIENESISTPEDVVDFLVKDEKEAIAGYEQAAEVVEASDVENKEEILATLDHIKEEEEEHIEELTDLVDDEIIEVENDPISTEEEVEESDEEEVEEIEDPESETLNEDTKSETRYWICFYDNNDVAVIEAADEDAAMSTFMNNYNDEYFFDSWDHDWSVEEISKEEYDEWEETYSIFPPEVKLTEHVNEEHPAIESDQKLVGTDNAVVDCETVKVITHSEDEKPLDCEMKKDPLTKPLTESSLVQGSYEISEVSSLSWGWDKDDGFYVEKLWRPSTDADIWETEFRRIYASEAAAKHAFDRYVKQSGGNSTGGKILSEDTHARYAKPEGDRRAAYANALKYANKEGKPFIYGYTNRAGKFFALEQPIKVTHSSVEAEKNFRAQYKNCNVVYIVYPTTDPFDEAIEMTATELKNKFGTDDVDLINAGREEEDRVVLVEDAEEDTSHPVEMANTASTSGMDFEAACKVFGVNCEQTK